jgi:hypothetical protein
VYRTYRVMATGKGVGIIGAVSDVEQSAIGPTHHIFPLCLSGPTTGRPKQGDSDILGPVPIGTFFVDTTLNAVIASDGKGGWRNPLTGASV